MTESQREAEVERMRADGRLVDRIDIPEGDSWEERLARSVDDGRGRSHMGRHGVGPREGRPDLARYVLEALTGIVIATLVVAIAWAIATYLFGAAIDAVVGL